MTMVRRPVDRSNVPMRSTIERLLGIEPFLQIPFQQMQELVPAIDVRETDDAYVVEVELPGVEPDGIEVLVEGRTLTVRGEFAEETQDGQALVRERRRGSFLRVLALPGQVDVDGVDTTYINGELRIMLPKASQERSRRIKVNGREQPAKGSGARDVGESSSAAPQPSGSRSRSATGSSR